MDIFLWFFGLGIAAGFFAGLLGIGGGLIVVPGLFYVFAQKGWSPSVVMHLALGSSLAMIVFTSLTTLYAQHVKQNIDWLIVRCLTPGLIVGAFFGALIASELNTTVLTQIFAAFIGAIAVHLLWNGRHGVGNAQPKIVPLSIGGTIAGFLAALLGLGGGVLLVPILNRLALHMRQIVAISSVCTIPVALVGMVSYIVLGWHAPGLPAHATGYVYWPAVGLSAIGSMLVAPLGVHIAHHIPGRILHRIFAFFLLLISLRMWWLAGA